jgi:hypothetical protein
VHQSVILVATLGAVSGAFVARVKSVGRHKGYAGDDFPEVNMLDGTWPGWGLWQSGITGATGLLGVFVGALATLSGQKRTRKNERARQQLEEFYSPLLGIRNEIRAKSELRTSLHSLAGAAYLQEVEVHNRNVPQDLKDKYDKLIQYSDDQLRKELVPQYEAMVRLYLEKRWLAEVSTLKFDYVLVEFVEIWGRFLEDTIPTRVLQLLDHSEAKLKPFYDDLQMCFDVLSKQLKK